MAHRWGNDGNSERLHFLGSRITADVDSAMKLKDACSLKEKLWLTYTAYWKEQRHYFANEDLSSQSYDFSCSHVWMWGLDHKESWRSDAFKLWYWRRVLRVPWTARRSNQSFLKEISPEYSSERPVLWPPGTKNWLIGKYLVAGKDWRQEEKGRTEDELVGWHHWFNGLEFEQASGVGGGQGSLVFCSPWYHKESDTTEALHWTGLIANTTQSALLIASPFSDIMK